MMTKIPLVIIDTIDSDAFDRFANVAVFLPKIAKLRAIRGGRCILIPFPNSDALRCGCRRCGPPLSGALALPVKTTICLQSS